MFLPFEMPGEQDATLGSQNYVGDKNGLNCVVMDNPAL